MVIKELFFKKRLVEHFGNVSAFELHNACVRCFISDLLVKAHIWLTINTFCKKWLKKLYSETGVHQANFVVNDKVFCIKSLTGFKLCATKSQQHSTTCNRVCKPTQHVTSNNVASVALGVSIIFVFNLAVTWDIVEKKCKTDLPARPYTPIFTLISILCATSHWLFLHNVPSSWAKAILRGDNVTKFCLPLTCFHSLTTRFVC